MAIATISEHSLEILQNPMSHLPHPGQAQF